MTRRFEIVLGHAFFGLGFGFLAVALWSALAPPPSGQQLAGLVVFATFGMATAGALIGLLNARNVSALVPAKARYNARRTFFYALGPVLITALVATIASFPPQ